jgi:nucleotide-binding universal stress UspA family protein
MDKIVVGTDGSEHGTRAMQWAVEEARLHHAEVEILLAWSLADQHYADHSDRFEHRYDEHDAGAALAAWVEEALGDAPGVSVGRRTACDLPVHALLEAGDAADLLVVGARGTGGFEGLLLGSVSDRVTQLASRPVAVIRDLAPVAGGRVVVGIDASARSLAAMRWAAAEAVARDAELDVVYAWQYPLLAAPPMVAVMPDFSSLEDAAREALDRALAHPALADARVRGHLTHGAPARRLIERAAGAGLLVVGTRGLGRVSGTLLGSVSRQLLHHAPCPVVVI